MQRRGEHNTVAGNSKSFATEGTEGTEITEEILDLNMRMVFLCGLCVL
jgi:hypothetical protein